MSLSPRFVALLCALTLLPAVAPAQAIRPSSDVPASKYEAYVGYGYWNPLSSNINNFRYDTVSDLNAAANFTYFFSQHLGVRIDGNYFNDDRTKTPGVSGICSPDATGKVRCLKDQSILTAAAGPLYRMQYGRFVPFAQVLGGAIRLNGPVVNPLQWGWMVDGGVGIDYILPVLHNRIALRPIQADYEYGHVKYGPLVLPAGIEGGASDIGAIHLSAGVVVRFGDLESKGPVELSCSAEPNLVYPGEPVTASAIARGFGKNPHLDYTWTLPAGMKSVHDSAVRMETGNLAPGEYHLNVQLREHAHSKKPTATCSTAFEVHAYEPPTLSCSAAPDTVTAGTPVTITATGRSASNLTLSYTYTASAGTITPGGATAELKTDGATPGSTITIDCAATDTRDQRATAQTTVTISAPPAPVAVPMPTPTPVAPATVPEVQRAQPLCTILFERDRKRPVRVDNEAKACLDSVALSKSRETLSKLVLVGTYTHGEGANSGAERALHAKEYLVDEKGIDASTVQTMVRAGDHKSVENVLLPGDAVFEDNGALEFDPNSVKLEGEAYGKHSPGTVTRIARHRRHRKH